MQGKTIRIGTRGSALALAQAREVRARLIAAHGLGEHTVSIEVIKTTGDVILDRPLAEAGGKGLFTKEIEEALIAGTIDLAVHSMKDMQTVLPDGLGIGAMLPREDVRDAFISPRHATLAEIPAGARVGTSSLRREAQVRRLRPDLELIGFRGNVETRLQKLRDGLAAATFLACAGLKRLGLEDRITVAMPTEVMLPAVAQGAIGIEVRIDDVEAGMLIAPLNCETTALAVTAERAFLARLEGSCRTPIAGLARLENGTVRFKGLVLSPDGSEALDVERQGSPREAARVGAEAAEDLLRRGADRIMVRAR